MKRRVFTREFKIGAVKMVKEQGHKVSQVAQDLGVDQTSIRDWIRKFTAEAGTIDTSADAQAMAAELQRLRKENVRLTMERDILKKATAYFAKENL